jgi:hypothetical protein
VKPLTPIQQRLADGAARRIEDPDAPLEILFQHTVLCQTCLPFRDPGDEVRVWERLNGDVHLKVIAGEAMHPKLRRLVPLGLPFGPKARMILMHINQQALLGNELRRSRSRTRSRNSWSARWGSTATGAIWAS